MRFPPPAVSRRAFTSAVAASGLSALGGRTAFAQTKLTPLSASVIGVSVSIWPAIVAQAKGFFAKEGLDFEMITAGSSARSLQQATAGAVDIGSSSMVDTVRAIDKGAKVKAFTNSLAVGTHSLIAAKSIASTPELKGKRVMTGGHGDVTNLWWLAMAKHFGFDGEKDVDLSFSGSTTNRLSALYAGGVDATVLSTPQSFQAIQDGWTDLGAVAPYLGDFPMMIWHANDDFAKMHPDRLAAFVRAQNAAVRYMSDPAHRQEVSEMLAKASSSSVDDALKTWDLCMKIDAFVPNGSISDGAVGTVLKTLADAGDIKGAPRPIAVYYDDDAVKIVEQNPK